MEVVLSFVCLPVYGVVFLAAGAWHLFWPERVVDFESKMQDRYSWWRAGRFQFMQDWLETQNGPDFLRIQGFICMLVGAFVLCIFFYRLYRLIQELPVLVCRPGVYVNPNELETEPS